MITVISGTNRDQSRSLQVANYYFDLLQSKEVNAHLLSLKDFMVYQRNEEVIKIENEVLIPSQKFIFIMPEYNGSFPGILKTLLDITDIKKCWWNKKALLVGVADGRGGNLRGLEHMTNILHYLKMNIYYNKLPISRINEEMDEEGKFIMEATRQSIHEQVESFITY